MSSFTIRSNKQSKFPHRRLTRIRKKHKAMLVGHHDRDDSGEAFLHDPSEFNLQVRSDEPLAEIFGQEFLKAANSGEDMFLEDINEVTQEEVIAQAQ